MPQLINSSTIVSCVLPAAGVAGQTAIDGSVIDMAGFRGALIIVQMGAITASAVTSIKAQHGDAPAMGDAADIVGTGQSIAVADANEIFYIDVSKVTKRYLRLSVSRGTANAVVASAVAVCYGASVAPTTQAATVTGETHVGKITGTA